MWLFYYFYSYVLNCIVLSLIYLIIVYLAMTQEITERGWHATSKDQFISTTNYNNNNNNVYDVLVSGENIIGQNPTVRKKNPTQ